VMINRRGFLRFTAGIVSVSLLAACDTGGEGLKGQQQVESASNQGRLRARPGPPPSHAAVSTGLRPLGLGSTRDGLLYVPAGYGSDVEFIDRALEWSFDRLALDTRRLAMTGFSDGASYALSLGLTNGNLFTHLIAFSPGFMAPGDRRGQPPVFVSHGTRDRVLPIEHCSRRIVPQLDRAGYQVHYREFDGPHTVPESIAREALHWFSLDAGTTDVGAPRGTRV
jgi:phospholipase/carboxylesterase